MPRTKCVVERRRRRKKILKEMKGGRGGRSKLFATAIETYYRGKRFAFRDRRERKREFRQLWIARISGALMQYDILYSRFIMALKQAQCTLNRKQLSEIAIYDPQSFASIVEMAKKYLPSPATKA